MPDSYFERPCPGCGGRVRHREGEPFAECITCGKRFTLKPQTGTADPPKHTKTASKRKTHQGESFTERLLGALKRLWRRIKNGLLSLYRGLYGKIRKKNARIPLPKPPAEDKQSFTPEPPMDEGQRALYAARKRQLESREGSSLPPQPPTKGEQLEEFVQEHRTFSIVISSVAAFILLVLLTVGIACCVKESRINKDDFLFVYGNEEITEKREYKFVAFKVKNNELRKISHRINMTALAELCELTISGTPASPKYAVRGGTSYVRFESGSAIVLVNGTNYQMDCIAEYDEEGDLWVDLYFADAVLGGMTVSIDTETNTITAARTPTPEGTLLDPVYEVISITGGNQAVHTGSGGIDSPTATYKTDISAYAADLYPSDPGYLILANKQHPLSAEHIPEDLTALTVPTTKRIELRFSAARALEAMFAEMAADGVTDVSITSGYRSYSYQDSLFSYYINEEMGRGLSYDDAVALVETYSSRPGFSEHQTGLCVDFWTSGMTDLTNEEFEGSDAAAWLFENAWKFGFILRYPSDKTDTTGYTYESWHYRFVGVDAATEIHKNGWCFEEYIEKHA